MKDTIFSTFQAFWPFYVSQHQNKTNRNLHFLGSSLALVCILLAVVNLKPWLLLAAPVVGYAFAWTGHFFFEKNRPATFKYPFWSFLGDVQMYVFMCRGRMDREVKRMGVLNHD